MATYKGIQGFTIQNLSADPSNPIEGQVWYNSTSNVWKVEEATTAGTWATGGDLNLARDGITGCGTQTAAIAFGGQTPTTPPTFLTSATELYNGSSWTSTTALPSARKLGTGFGTQTAAISAGADSSPLAIVSSWNGTSWTSATSLSTGRFELASAGNQAAAIVFGGYDGGPVATGSQDITESWDGSVHGLVDQLWLLNNFV
jgi:hypothetical protein